MRLIKERLVTSVEDRIGNFGRGKSSKLKSSSARVIHDSRCDMYSRSNILQHQLVKAVNI